MNSKFKLFSLFIFIIVLCNFSYSLNLGPKDIYSNNTQILDKDYYANLNIVVDNNGDVYFKGNTNYDLFKGISSKYTSKKGEYWVVNITTQDRFSDYIYELQLPENAEVNYIKTSKLSRIISGKNVKIVGYGKNDKFTIIVQYKINKNISQFNYFLLAIILLIILGISYFSFKKFNNNNNVLNSYNILKNNKNNANYNNSSYNKNSNYDNENNNNNSDDDNYNYKENKDIDDKTIKKVINYDLLTERQINIVNIIIKNNYKIHQFELERICGIPKSSLSRNIKSLVNKGILIKEQKGMSNLILLDEKYVPK